MQKKEVVKEQREEQRKQVEMYDRTTRLHKFSAYKGYDFKLIEYLRNTDFDIGEEEERAHTQGSQKSVTFNKSMTLKHHTHQAQESPDSDSKSSEPTSHADSENSEGSWRI